ncbi:riboflavin synthase alpha chain [Pontibacter mucosus]|uniref:Riboflavin synthase n=1 Tax=Pontibacter mucosus TaxID=1649266 RepID=A0A2T5YLU9_9BACT|nr:riboflavin synthase [Pontibacter mucosus]PTX20293.1 riboflavin synthase alpha chain [Pontibacter mucosus]
MFTGIIEALGRVTDIRQENTNKHFTLTSPFTHELKIDQSVAHNGVCLTVVRIDGDAYTVTAIDETLKKTNLNELQIGDVVNLERCMLANGRFDGHVVQGHVDQTAVCEEVKDENGSWLFTFRYDASKGNVTVEKGSICVNGISLTVVNSQEDRFSVAIIPYTYEHTNLHAVKPGTTVNLEFDIIGKYVARLLGKV